MRPWLQHPKVTLVARVVLGLVFLLAAFPKIVDPPGFAKAIWTYDLLPAWSLHPLALVLPWLELFCGLALCLGFWVRATAMWVAALLLSFSLALAINLARNHPVDCGCFGSAAPKTETQRLADMRWLILRDMGLLLLAARLLTTTRTNLAAGRHPGKENGT